MVVTPKDVTISAAAPGTGIQYRVEHLTITEHPEVHLSEVLDKLNEFGREGWLVASVDLTHHPSMSPAAQPSTMLPVLLEKSAGSARRVEYRIERMPFQEHPEKHVSELVTRLNELGAQGWRVACADLTHHPSYSPAAQPNVPLPVLLEREL